MLRKMLKITKKVMLLKNPVGFVGYVITAGSGECTE